MRSFEKPRPLPDPHAVTVRRMPEGDDDGRAVESG